MSTKITKKFADNLGDLIADSKKPIKQLAEEIGVPAGSLSKYQNDSAEPGIVNFTKIANYFNVSTDWLLGLTKVRTTDLDIREISEKTGLTEEAIDNIKRITCSHYYPWSIEPPGTLIGDQLPPDYNTNKMLNALLESASLSRVVLKASFLSLRDEAYRTMFSTEEEYQERGKGSNTETELLGFEIFKLQEAIKTLLYEAIGKRSDK